MNFTGLLKKDEDRLEQTMSLQQFVPETGFLPVTLVSRGLNVIESSFNGGPLPYQASDRPSFKLDVKTQDITDLIFTKVLQPQGNLLSSEDIAIQQVKAAVGIDRKGLFQLPLEDRYLDLAYKTLQGQVFQDNLMQGNVGRNNIGPGPPGGGDDDDGDSDYGDNFSYRPVTERSEATSSSRSSMYPSSRGGGGGFPRDPSEYESFRQSTNRTQSSQSDDSFRNPLGLRRPQRQPLNPLSNFDPSPQQQLRPRQLPPVPPFGSQHNLIPFAPSIAPFGAQQSPGRLPSPGQQRPPNVPPLSIGGSDVSMRSIASSNNSLVFNSSQSSGGGSDGLPPLINPPPPPGYPPGMMSSGRIRQNNMDAADLLQALINANMSSERGYRASTALTNRTDNTIETVRPPGSLFGSDTGRTGFEESKRQYNQLPAIPESMRSQVSEQSFRTSDLPTLRNPDSIRDSEEEEKVPNLPVKRGPLPSAPQAPQNYGLPNPVALLSPEGRNQLNLFVRSVIYTNDNYPATFGILNNNTFASVFRRFVQNDEMLNRLDRGIAQLIPDSDEAQQANYRPVLLAAFPYSLGNAFSTEQMQNFMNSAFSEQEIEELKERHDDMDTFEMAMLRHASNTNLISQDEFDDIERIYRQHGGSPSAILHYMLETGDNSIIRIMRQAGQNRPLSPDDFRLLEGMTDYLFGSNPDVQSSLSQRSEQQSSDQQQSSRQQSARSNRSRVSFIQNTQENEIYGEEGLNNLYLNNRQNENEDEVDFEEIKEPDSSRSGSLRSILKSGSKASSRKSTGGPQSSTRTPEQPLTQFSETPRSARSAQSAKSYQFPTQDELNARKVDYMRFRIREEEMKQGLPPGQYDESAFAELFDDLNQAEVRQLNRRRVEETFEATVDDPNFADNEILAEFQSLARYFVRHQDSNQRQFFIDDQLTDPRAVRSQIENMYPSLIDRLRQLADNRAISNTELAQLASRLNDQFIATTRRLIYAIFQDRSIMDVVEEQHRIFNDIMDMQIEPRLQRDLLSDNNTSNSYHRRLRDEERKDVREALGPLRDNLMALAKARNAEEIEEAKQKAREELRRRQIQTGLDTISSTGSYLGSKAFELAQSTARLTASAAQSLASGLNQTARTSYSGITSIAGSIRSARSGIQSTLAETAKRLQQRAAEREQKNLADLDQFRNILQQNQVRIRQIEEESKLSAADAAMMMARIMIDKKDAKKGSGKSTGRMSVASTAAGSRVGSRIGTPRRNRSRRGSIGGMNPIEEMSSGTSTSSPFDSDNISYISRTSRSRSSRSSKKSKSSKSIKKKK